jgi:hypothetical protein
MTINNELAAERRFEHHEALIPEGKLVGEAGTVLGQQSGGERGLLDGW